MVSLSDGGVVVLDELLVLENVLRSEDSGVLSLVLVEEVVEHDAVDVEVLEIVLDRVGTHVSNLFHKVGHRKKHIVFATGSRNLL